MKKDFFRLQEHGTTAKREVLAGGKPFVGYFSTKA